MPLAACGGGGSPAATTPPPPLGPDYTENPTGTFTGRDNANLTLAQGSATTDLTVNSKGGNDGNDTIADFEDTVDLLDFSGSTLTFADLTITQNGADTFIEDGLGNSITLTGITSTDITVDDFIF